MKTNSFSEHPFAESSRHRAGILVLLALCGQGLAPVATAQLAITEVMSYGSTNGLPGIGSQRPDFWELTNFGDHPIDLTGYRWFDADNVANDILKTMPSISIGAGESILFVRDNTIVPDADSFREWWGSGLSPDIQIHFWYLKPGFDQVVGDAIRVWDRQGNLVDEARFGPGRQGVTFTYETNSGAFTDLSAEGVGGAFRAAQGGDVGSPGSVSTRPVSPRIELHPSDQSLDAGYRLILRVQATGRPQPRFQWYHNGEPVQSEGISRRALQKLVGYAGCGPAWEQSPGQHDFVIVEAKGENAGAYSVEVFNDLERVTSLIATVTVNTTPSPIVVECPQNDFCIPCGTGPPIPTLEAVLGQTAWLSVRTRGFPLRAFQWSRSSDGLAFVDLPGETNRELSLIDFQTEDAGTYRVEMRNEVNVTSAQIRVSVATRPRLRITEVMSQACSATERDWWELTNIGDEPVNLCGYRWDDQSAKEGDVIMIGGGPTITNAIVLDPGESVILLESQTSGEFVQWWGESNLPKRQKFIAYAANGLGHEGDSLYVWHPNEFDGLLRIHTVGFSDARAGFTLWFDTSICASSEVGLHSAKGECGAFQAAQACEIGSPGWTQWTRPQITQVRREGQNVRVSWRAQPGSRNRLEFARRLAVAPSVTEWSDLGEFTFPSADCEATDATIAADTQRFYRIVRTAAANCPCPEDP